MLLVICKTVSFGIKCFFFSPKTHLTMEIYFLYSEIFSEIKELHSSKVYPCAEIQMAHKYTKSRDSFNNTGIT